MNHSNRNAFRSAACLSIALLCGDVSAATKQKAAPSRPNFSGFWTLAPRVKSDQELMAKIAPNTVILDDVGAPELPAGNYGGLKLKPEALAAAQKWNPREQMTLSKVCEAPSIAYATQGPFPMEVHLGTELMVIKLEYYDLVRVIFLDGRPHPPASAPHSKVGHSIGRWEGSVLVVDTTHLKASTITNNGADHSDNLHMIERFKLSADGKNLLLTQEYEDPDVLENRGARFIAWRLVPGQYVNPYECDPSWAAELAK